MTNYLETILAHYEETINLIKEARASNSINSEQIIRALNTRDKVQIALKKSRFVHSSKLNKLIELDVALREELKVILNATNSNQDLRNWHNPSRRSHWQGGFLGGTIGRL